MFQVLKLLAEMSSFCGDMEKLETNLRKLFDKLLVRTFFFPCDMVNFLALIYYQLLECEN